MIETHALTKRYGQTTVVDAVSLDFPPGGLSAIIGPNGAGKSTLLCMLARLLDADGGEVRLDGRALADWPNADLACRLAILRQDNHLAMRLSVRDLVSFGRYPHSKGRITPADREQIAAALAYMDLEAIADRFLDELSGGQSQRAFIAMVLAQDTDYILLDEPLNNLDLRHAHDMMRQLRQLADERGKTVLVVLHDINFAAAWSDRIIAMKNGRLLHAGPPAEIMRPEVLEEIYDLSMPVHQLGAHPAGLYWLPAAARE
ncbi:MAG: iron ABC transporter ATP-binding protein [Candidatus Dactylopiibacterium carminicum]|nr:MAG: iron ABC transporter ATP-binding protein [Candidatus Dactylopiibacterium carminicum]